MPGPHDRPLKIGAAARHLKVGEAALRFYEREGLIAPARTAGGTRLYFPHHLRRLESILKLARAGVELEEIRNIIHAREGCLTGRQSSRKVGELLKKRLSEIRHKRKDLQLLEKELETSLKLVARCRTCDNHPDSAHCPDCPVNRHLGEPPLLDLFWE